MSPFMIFALVLTIAYVLYYAVVVAKDLQGKKGIVNSTEEVFDLDDMEEEESVEVSETADSFQVGNTGEKQPEPSGSDANDFSEQPEETPRNAAEEKAEQLKSDLLEADITSENGVTAPELHELLEGKRETLFKIPMKITRNEL
ncbi:hypothetical protein LIZ89_07030 [Bacteroides uniformis]|uniref:hypothetical protein n=1 Tax=Bacteroidaceae TaxID=815 RepID=UPI001D08849B|nr:hypothetical protein [Bacteroides uniformis]MCB7404001.1 hypothetical protein [Bacteroides uniformis]MCB7415146.1 hypothetical protein [Bacteroides uniformis]